MGQGDAADTVRQPLQVVLPAVRGLQHDVGVAVELVHDGLHDAVDQALPARDVAVQGHGLHAEARAEAAHRQLAHAVLVDELHRRAEHPPPVEPRTSGGRRPGRHRRGGAAALLGQVGVAVGVVHRTSSSGHRVPRGA
jgi:hypothetical protein